MKAIEFTTIIKNGVIHIPEKYDKLTNQSVRIIVLTEEDSVSYYKQDVETIKAVLENIKERKVFQKIKYPLSWQKSLRDEWR